MEVYLYQIAFLAVLQERLGEVTKNDVRNLEPMGGKVPENYTLVGFVPDPLKALLVLNDRYNDCYYNLFVDSIRAEFPAIACAREQEIGFGPNFEIYRKPDTLGLGIVSDDANQSEDWGCQTSFSFFSDEGR